MGVHGRQEKVFGVVIIDVSVLRREKTRTYVAEVPVKRHSLPNIHTTIAGKAFIET